MAGMSGAASGIVLEPLTRDNYENWSALVKNYLIGQGLWGAMTSVSEIGVKAKTVSDSWKRRNAKALHIIQLACGTEILSQIRDVETAKEAWNRLGALYSSQLKADSDIEQGIYAFKSLWFELSYETSVLCFRKKCFKSTRISLR